MPYRWPIPSFSLLVALAVAPWPAAAQDSQPDVRFANPSVARVGVDPRHRAALWRPEAEHYRQDTTRTICRGAAIPTGWLLVNDARDPRSCGGDNPAALSAFNVWVIQRYDDRPVNTVLEVCAMAPTPDGWALVDIYRRNDRCGRAPDAFQVNVKRIRRAR
jgi:hypothetical protein